MVCDDCIECERDEHTLRIFEIFQINMVFSLFEQLGFSHFK